MSKPPLRTCVKIQIIDVASSAQRSGDTAGELTTVEVIVITVWMQVFPDNVQLGEVQNMFYAVVLLHLVSGAQTEHFSSTWLAGLWCPQVVVFIWRGRKSTVDEETNGQVERETRWPAVRWSVTVVSCYPREGWKWQSPPLCHCSHHPPLPHLPPSLFLLCLPLFPAAPLCL